MGDTPRRRALFAGLVVDPQGNPLETTCVGAKPFYVVLDAGFRRHVEADKLDRQVLTILHEQILDNRALVTQSMLAFVGQDDLFTKAMIDASLDKVDENITQLLQTGLPEEVQTWLSLLGFRITVDIHGEIIQIDSPGLATEEE